MALQVRILHAWLTSPARCAELWSWQPPDNRYRNPFPRMRAEVRRQFGTGDAASQPLMLELMWKQRQTHLDVLPKLLHEADPEPLLVAAYGKAAVPHLAASLQREDQNQWPRERLLNALGATGDPNAVPILVDHLVRAKGQYDGPGAARSIMQLGSPDVLRHTFAKVESPFTRRAILELLTRDTSKTTLQFLQRVAKDSPRGELRVTAFRSLIREPARSSVTHQWTNPRYGLRYGGSGPRTRPFRPTRRRSS